MIAEANIPQGTRLRSICVLGSVEPGRDASVLTAARRLGQEIALGAIRLVYGGGSSGVTGAVAKGAASCNGDVVAVPHKSQLDRMHHAPGVQQVVAVGDMHIRKRLMFDYADAFVALPGGVDTLDAMAEVLAWRQLGQHHKPLVLANITGLWTPWLDLLKPLEASGYIADGTTRGLLVTDEVTQILPILRNAMQQREEGDFVPYEIAIEEAGGCYSPPNP